MSVNILFIGDPHIQVSNFTEVELFIERIINLATERQPDLIIIAGDLLHNHERLHTLALNKAYDMVNDMRLIAKTYVLVGNHDYISNQQFLSQNHWMNGLKEWDNTIIVDQVMTETIRGEKFVFVPYVSPGRFEEALNTLHVDWRDASCIFAHQEFFGCKMGAIVSVEGDKWCIDNPHVISGHIHSRQSPQANIYYSGSAMQHAFGESNKNIIACLTFEDGKYTNEEVDLKLPRKRIIYIDVEDVENYSIPDTSDKIKVTITGSYEQFKALKKTKKYKDMVKKGDTKIVFKPKKLINEEIDTEHTKEKRTFKSILDNLILEEKNNYLTQAYELIVNEREIGIDDVIFL
jgi:DNA repair exonuclease SbcCD nuclease subunit